MDREAVGRRLRQIREDEGEGQGRMAVRLGCAQQTISKYENGQVPKTWDTLRRLCGPPYYVDIDSLLREGE